MQVDPVSAPDPSHAASVLLLAVIQGLAEFLPISSSGHLVLARVAMSIEEGGMALDVALHVGTLLAVLWAYRADVGSILVGMRRGEWRFPLWIVAATVPIGIVGVGFKDELERAFETAQVAGAGLLVTAAVLVAGELIRRRHAARRAANGTAQPVTDLQPGWVDALILGLAQSLAILPGVSRSGMTIAVGMMRGFSPAQAARLSFLMSIPAVTGAAVVSLPDAVAEGFSGLSPTLIWSAVALSALVGWGALRTLLLTLARGSFLWFAAYCGLLGLIVLRLA